MPRHIRLSASDLDGYRFWKSSDDSTIVDLRRRLLHQEPPTENMLAGRAFAKLLEFARDGEVLHQHELDGWRFTFECDSTLRISRHREVKTEAIVETPSALVTLVAKCDIYGGLQIRDAKLTERLDPEKYFDSLQWRTYLWLFSAQEFVYDLFQARYAGRQVTLVEHLPFSCTAYPNLGQDVRQAVAELAAVVVDHVPEMVT